MKLKFKVEGLDCANCAAKAERGINAIDGVESASISFITEKMIINCPENRIDEIVEQAVKILGRVEPDAKLIRL
jgi:copper chaperone CopZ